MSIASAVDHRVVAFNSSKTSENKIHDDSVARQYGFAGGLVPGVNVYAYMTHAAVTMWGRAWLERGSMTARFLKPVYEGEEVAISVEPAADRTVAISAVARGEDCGVGEARLSAATPAPPKPDDFPRLDPPRGKPPASVESLPAGRMLASFECRQSPEEAAQYLKEIGEDKAIYAEAGLMHPGFLLRLSNWALRENVALGPWIHVSSEVQNFAAVPVGTDLSARGRVLETFERKGHEFAVLDVAVFTGLGAPVQRVKHTAIYRPRPVAG